jgi:hypothetical protein
MNGSLTRASLGRRGPFSLGDTWMWLNRSSDTAVEDLAGERRKAITEILNRMQETLVNSAAKLSTGDYVKLLALEKELQDHGNDDGPLEVGWVDPEDDI